MSMLRCVVLVLAWSGYVAQASSLGHAQREAFQFWQKQELNERSNRLSSRQQTNPSCVSATPSEGLADKLNGLLSSGGENYTLSLCPNTTYALTAPLVFTSKNQEISTAGYPLDDARAVLLVNGSTANDGTGHTVAIQGGCGDCAGIKMRNIQIDGNRQGAPPIAGGGNMEIGGSGGSQLVEFVKSHSPRGWSCLHIAEGVLDCTNATVRYNDIGPCGSDTFGHWADGISLSCRNSNVHDNWIVDPTDGGIVIFQSPGSLVQNNTIWIENNTCLGGINLVDYDPFSGNYTDVMVRENTIIGGYANVEPTINPQYGNNTENAIIKIGLAVGLRVWFGTKWGDAAAFGGAVIGNKLSGAFGFGMAISGIKDFTIANNTLFGNSTFIGAKGPNCTTNDIVPPAVDFVIDTTAATDSSVSGVYKAHGITALLCLTPPRGGGDVWPVGTWPNSSLPLNNTTVSPTVGVTTPASGWCLAGEEKWACARRFIKELLGADIVSERRL